MDRYYVSISDPTPTPEGFQSFQKDAFVDVVRSILCAFYDDGEILVANFLLEGDIAFTDQQIAETLGLSQRQVRSILEARLCKDFIVEAEIPTVGQMNNSRGAQGTGFMGMTSAWYRVCPDVLNATWYRMTQTEKAIIDRLKATQENESYVCYRCGNREFDSLRAVSLYSVTDGMFHCDICDDILHVRENKSLREKLETTLKHYYAKFEHLKEKLESMRRMYIPRHIVLKKTVYDKMLEDAAKGHSTAGTLENGQTSNAAALKRDFTEFSNALSNLSLSGGRGGVAQATSAPEWIRQAQTVSMAGGLSNGADESSLPLPAANPLPSKSLPPKDIDQLIKKHKTGEDDTTAKIKIIETGNSFVKKEEPGLVGDSFTSMASSAAFVSVGGVSYEFAAITDELIEQMTDEEYMVYDKLIQKVGFK